MMPVKRLLAAAAAAVCALGLGVLASGATPGASAAGPPVLFYTTNHPAALKVADYSLSGDTLSVGSASARVLASLPAADGLAFAPDGDLLVGGGDTGNVFKINPTTGAVVTEPSGIKTAFHVTVSPDGSTAWTAGLPGELAKVPLRPFGPGTRVPLRGDDAAVSTIGFTPTGAFYTESNSFGSGNFGTFDPATGTTHRTQLNLRGAHGFAYDPYSKHILLFGSYRIVEIDPAHPDTLLSQRDVANMSFDQGVVDGQGHLMAASNSGDLVYIDYAATGQLTAKSPGSKAFLDTNLDDIATHFAPLPVAASSGGSSKNTKLLILLIAVVVVAAVFVVIRRRR